jgi:threonine dehydrogenase-like Zn-dependent dehydrogenase
MRDGGVEVAEVPAPSGDGVRVRIVSAGICGSDLHLLTAGFPVPGILGHEIAGEAEDGTPVAVEPLAPCGGCAQCLAGDYHRCERGSAIVMGSALDGGMADEMRVPARCLVPLPGGLEPRDACLVEPLAVGVHGLRRAGVRGDAKVLVVGGGSIGLCALAAARGVGCEVALLARHDAQREAGARLGGLEAEGVYDVVIDAAGTADALATAVERCLPGGTLLSVATYWGGMELPGFSLCMKEVNVVPASMYGRGPEGRDIDAAATLLAREPEIAGTLITHRFPLDAAPEAFRVAGDRAAGAIKVVLEP